MVFKTHGWVLQKLWKPMGGFWIRNPPVGFKTHPWVLKNQGWVLINSWKPKGGFWQNPWVGFWKTTGGFWKPMGGFWKSRGGFQNPWVGFDFLTKMLKKISTKKLANKFYILDNPWVVFKNHGWVFKTQGWVLKRHGLVSVKTHVWVLNGKPTRGF